MLAEKVLAFIGGGNMAEALIKGVREAELVKAEQILVTDLIEKRRDYLQARYHVEPVLENRQAVSRADIVILAVKPQDIEVVLQEIQPAVTDRHLLVSIAAGVPLAKIHQHLQKPVRSIRVMPNTPALVQSGAAALCRGEHATLEDLRMAQAIFDAVGKTVVVSEYLMDAVTGLSGSGPAYVFVLIEALADAGVKVGLPRDVALTLATQTVLGSAKMVLETGEHPGRLKDRVTSPGGTTISGLHALERGRFRATIMDAVEAATNRSRELGQ
ncbi:MAG: pyrroline-5-carboxylate reductase [Nitrospinota bacterium]|nr:MAG: pyrroline-5-carboxylate reductase [Nitrospinota bacterium]